MSEKIQQIKKEKPKIGWVRCALVIFSVIAILLISIWILKEEIFLPDRVKQLNAIPKNGSPTNITEELKQIYEVGPNISQLISKLIDDGFYVKSYAMTPYIWDKDLFGIIVFNRKPSLLRFCSTHIVVLRATKKGDWSVSTVRTYTSCYL